jgi:hypothetical protein
MVTFMRRLLYVWGQRPWDLSVMSLMGAQGWKTSFIFQPVVEEIGNEQKHYPTKTNILGQFYGKL